MNKNLIPRQGIICAGNWIVDLVSFIDSWPQQGNLSYITQEVKGLGGCSANQTFALTQMDPTLNVLPIGCIGKDEYAKYILDQCTNHNIPKDYLIQLSDTPTSHTLVIQNASSGQRTFFHNKGANALLNLGHIPLDKLCDYKIFSLGYLLLLDKLDQLTSNSPNITFASQLLKYAQELGFITCVDAVSENSDRFRQIIPASLPYADYLIVNELEAGRIVNYSARDSQDKLDLINLKNIAKDIIAMGTKNVIIHFPEGALWCSHDICEYYPNILVPASEIVSSVGAGDAFCSGILYGIHQEYTKAQTVALAIYIAKSCLKGLTATDNIPNIQQFVTQHFIANNE